jgi:nicotinate phosphoribosyltransferase
VAIVTSLMDNDWYKFTMPPVVRRFYSNVRAGFAFINRNTDFPVAEYVDLVELKEELAAMRDVAFTQSDLDFLGQLGVLDPAYIKSLEDYRLPEVHAEVWGTQLRVEAEGDWDQVMPVEIPVLQIITELASRALAREAGLTLADIRRHGHAGLDEIVALMRAHPAKKLAPFGARRRFSGAWEREATANLVHQIPDQIAGISNVMLAREFGYPLAGTIAHEFFIIPTMIQVARGTPNPIGAAQNQAMDAWEAMYGQVWQGRMLCAIPDTFGTDNFLANFTPERAAKWQVFKQDSGDPKAFVGKVTGWLHRHGFDASRYRINHTDGLNVAAMEELFRFADRHPSHYQDGYGLGTGMTNNVGVPTHSFVWKPAWVMVDGQKVPAVKLSDNLAKACGDPVMIERVKSLAGYTNTYSKLQTV